MSKTLNINNHILIGVFKAVAKYACIFTFAEYYLKNNHETCMSSNGPEIFSYDFGLLLSVIKVPYNRKTLQFCQRNSK